jgi:hypothetical protein
MLACYVATLILLPRLSRLAMLSVAAFTLLGATPGIVGAEPIDCRGAKPDPAAAALMTAIERDVRRGTRVIRMRIEPYSLAITSASGDSNIRLDAKTLWAVLDSDEHETRSLYVFSGPGRLAGTSLLIRDRIGTLDGDAMWLYLRSFESFTHIESTARRRTVVPGTSLTYEDAKGFIATDKYRFAFADEPTSAAAEISACPLTGALAEDLGYGALRLSVDRDKALVVAIDYQDLAGKPLKRYRVEEKQQVGGRWFPKSVLLEHLANGTRTPIAYAYWLPDEAPSPELFAAGVGEETFRPRILRYLDSLGLAASFRAELLAADESVRRWEEKWSKGYPDGPGDR